MEMERVHVLIKGQVQGVFFRSSTRDIANSLGLSGCVRNLPNGSVEAIFEGPKDKLRRAVQWCHQGPPGASVTHVDEKWIGFTDEFDSFDIAY